jgi:tRNA dimethylallyltransferase
MKSKPHVIVVLGPTASGKSDYAVDLALKHNGEIISADSKQVYIGLDIGTGKITKEEMAGVPHYMLDVCDPSVVFSVSDYKALALPILEDILSRGKTPIICGGTGQYIDALIYRDTFAQVLPNKVLREKLENTSTEELFEQLKKRDPRRARVIDKHNRVRLIRALEIVEALGQVPLLSEKELRYDITMYIMSPTKEQLLERIKIRLEKRLEAGMLDEGRALRKNFLTRPIPDSRIASLGLEYKWMNMYLKNEITYDEMKEKLLTTIWRYAKRQMTWNKKYESFGIKVPI